MNKKKIKLILIITLILIFIILFSIKNSTLAIDPDDPNWNPNPEFDESVTEKSGQVLGWIQYIGIIVGVIALAIIGLKYIFSSVEGKAEYKKAMIPYIIGCFLLMSISLVIVVIGNIVIDDSTQGTSQTGGGRSDSQTGGDGSAQQVQLY